MAACNEAMPRNAPHVQTFHDGISGGCVLQAFHGDKSSETQFVVWKLEPAPHVFLYIVRFVKGSIVRFLGMPKFGVKKSLGQGLGKITGALETLIKVVEAHHDLTVVREPDEGPQRRFHVRAQRLLIRVKVIQDCAPERSGHTSQTLVT